MSLLIVCFKGTIAVTLEQPKFHGNLMKIFIKKRIVDMSAICFNLKKERYSDMEAPEHCSWRCRGLHSDTFTRNKQTV